MRHQTIKLSLASKLHNLLTRKKSLPLTLALSQVVLFTHTTYANEGELERQIAAGKCSEVMSQIEKESAGMKAYHRGLCHLVSQDFNKADEELLKSYNIFKQQGNKGRPAALLYNLANAFYGNNKLKRARQAYLDSAQINYQLHNSYYYAAYTSQLLEEFDEAIKYFKILANDSKAGPDVQQVSTFQMADAYLLKAESDKKDTQEFVKQYVISNYEKAINIAPKGRMVPDIAKKMNDIKAKYHLDPNILITGRRIPDNKVQAFLSQTVTYDNNMTLATDLPTLQASSKDSYIFKSSVSAGRQFFAKQRYTLVPNISYNWTRHTDQDNSSVYQNDGYDYTLSLKTRTEHFAFAQPAGLLIEADYNKTYRDFRSLHDPDVFSKAWSLSVGDSFSYFKLGGTTVTYKYRSSTGYIASLDNRAHSLTLVQTHLRPNQHLIIFLFVGTLTRLPSAPRNDTDSYMFRLDYIIPEILPKFILNPSLSMTLLDTKEQKASRGVERNLTPGVKLTRKSGDHVQTSIFYNYTNNQSKNESANEYKKVQYGFELKYIF